MTDGVRIVENHRRRYPRRSLRLNQRISRFRSIPGLTVRGRTPTFAVPGYDELLARWLGFSDMQHQCLDALANEVRRTSDLVETSTLEISSRFRDLAASAQEQTQRVEDIISVANSVTIDGEVDPARPCRRDDAGNPGRDGQQHRQPVEAGDDDGLCAGRCRPRCGRGREEHRRHRRDQPPDQLPGAQCHHRSQPGGRGRADLRRRRERGSSPVEGDGRSRRTDARQGGRCRGRRAARATRSCATSPIPTCRRRCWPKTAST